ncbi:MAG: hypothetical protein QFB86_01935 [Patescibacteria group bacterium]|nr:hypothetical protein [Patescibacteria group bacterium]
MSETIRIGHLNVDSPWGNAGGVVRSVEDVAMLARSGVGWIEAGSYTTDPRAGNNPRGEKVYVHNADQGYTANSLGMPNKGIEVAVQQIPTMVEAAHAQNKPFIINVAPVSADPAGESRRLVAKAMYAGADAVLLNASCPNVETPDGSRSEVLSYSPGALKLTLNALRTIVDKKGQQIFIRVSPMIVADRCEETMSIIRESGSVSAVFTPNTWPIDGTLFGLQVNPEMGGLSGPYTKTQSCRETANAVRCLKGSAIDVVSSSGIMNGFELATRMALGAVAGCGTTFFYESAEEGWSAATDRLLWEYTEAQTA